MFLLIKDGVVRASVNYAKKELNYIQTDRGRFLDTSMKIEEVQALPTDFFPGKYLYDRLEGFTRNPDFRESATMTDIEELRVMVEDLAFEVLLLKGVI